MEKNTIIDIMRLNSRSKKHLLINGTKICTFEVPKDLEDWRTYVYFSGFVKDRNCPRASSYAKVDILDKITFEKSSGKVYVNVDKDLSDDNQYSMTLTIDDEKSGKIASMLTVQSCEIEDDQIA